MVLLEVDKPLQLPAVQTVVPAADLHAIRVDNRSLEEVIKFLGTTGASYHSTEKTPALAACSRALTKNRHRPQMTNEWGRRMLP